MRKQLNILLADASPLYREGIKLALEGDRHQIQFFEVAAFDALMKILRNKPQLDLLILEAGLMRSGEIRKLKAQLRSCAIPVMLTCNEVAPVFLHNIRSLGVQGVIEKTVSLNELYEATMTLLSGATWLPKSVSVEPDNEQVVVEPSCISKRMSLLTIREQDVLEQLSEGLMNKQIAYRMGITENTVKFHVSQILRKLQASSRTGLVVSMYRCTGNRLL